MNLKLFSSTKASLEQYFRQLQITFFIQYQLPGAMVFTDAPNFTAER